jgi:Collagen triple helix repeat (20 copies)
MEKSDSGTESEKRHRKHRHHEEDSDRKVWRRRKEIIDVKIKDGKDGRDGKNGEHGKNGKNGKDGECGKDGKNGKNGKDGKDGKDGRKGKKGKRGHDGERGHPGVIPGYAYAVNDSTSSSISQGGAVPFTNTNFPNREVIISGSTITLQKSGTYSFSYGAAGTLSTVPNPVILGLVVDGTTPVFGSSVTGISGAQISGTVIASFPDEIHGITSGDGTVLQLANLSAGTLTIGNPGGFSNAFISIQRLA